jgi:hypothetical protein
MTEILIVPKGIFGKTFATVAIAVALRQLIVLCLVPAGLPQ